MGALSSFALFTLIITIILLVLLVTVVGVSFWIKLQKKKTKREIDKLMDHYKDVQMK